MLSLPFYSNFFWRTRYTFFLPQFFLAHARSAVCARLRHQLFFFRRPCSSDCPDRGAQDEFGTWHLYIPDKPDGTSPIPHNSRYKIAITTSTGEETVAAPRAVA